MLGKNIVIATAHKVGSTWLTNILREVCPYQQTQVPVHLRKNESNPSLLDLENKNCQKYLDSLDHLYLFKSHSLPPQWISQSRHHFITVYRDPRDIIISNIFYLANLDPKLGGNSQLFDTLNNKQRIIWYLDNKQVDLTLLEEWRVCDAAFKIHYESLLADTERVICNLIKSLGLEVNNQLIHKAVKKNSFQAKTGRKAGNEDTTSFFRKGISGDWKNHFDEDSIAHFKSVKNGRWNKLLMAMRYEKNDDWTL